MPHAAVNMAVGCHGIGHAVREPIMTTSGFFSKQSSASAWPTAARQGPKPVAAATLTCAAPARNWSAFCHSVSAPIRASRRQRQGDPRGASRTGYTLRAWRHTVTVGACLAASLMGSCVAARPPGWPRTSTPNLFDRDNVLYAFGDLGPGAPLGLVGVGVGFAPAPYFAFELGGGASTSGPQAAATFSVRGRVGHNVTTGLSTGVSAGPAIDHEPDLDDILDESPPKYVKSWSWAFWSNTEAQLRQALSEHVALRYRLGIAVPFATTGAKCQTTTDAVACNADKLSSVVPYVGFGVEYAP
jgi:hypothetical protein